MAQANNNRPATVKHVYISIANITAKLAVHGISKDNKNAQQGYSFRGIDDIYNALSKHLAEEGMVIIPRIISRNLKEVTTAKGGILFYVTLEAEYDFVSTKDGSIHTARVFGEAMDSGDKATNKAMSAAYKYLCLQTFCIPTENGNSGDADAQTHQVTGIANVAEQKQQAQQTAFNTRYQTPGEVNNILGLARELGDLVELYRANSSLVNGDADLLECFKIRKAALHP